MTDGIVTADGQRAGIRFENGEVEGYDTVCATSGGKGLLIVAAGSISGAVPSVRLAGGL